MTRYAALRGLVRLQGRPFTITEAAQYARVPGRTPAGKVQKLRRLEREGHVPAARRSLVHGVRFSASDEVAGLAERVMRLRRALNGS